MSTAAGTSAGWAQQRRHIRIAPAMKLDTLTEAARLLARDLRADPPVEMIPVRRAAGA